jgi:hypothetical protein
MIVRGQTQRQSYGFGTFVATRVPEIQRTFDPTERWWVQGNQNPADMTTRVAVVSYLVTEYKWQRGPDCLRIAFGWWPRNQENTIDSNKISDGIGIMM